VEDNGERPARVTPGDLSVDLTAALDAAQRGDEAGFVALYRDVQPRLLRYATVLVGRDSAEDVTAEAWLQISRDLHGFTGDVDRFRGWAATIVHHRAMDACRANARRPTAARVPGTEPCHRQRDPGLDADDGGRSSAQLRDLADHAHHVGGEGVDDVQGGHVGDHSSGPLPAGPLQEVLAEARELPVVEGGVDRRDEMTVPSEDRDAQRLPKGRSFSAGHRPSC
jgi:hypothetical protein